MPRASKTIYELGRTKFGQRLSLEHRNQGVSSDGWFLIQHQVNQRDETQTIYLPERLAAILLEKL